MRDVAADLAAFLAGQGLGLSLPPAAGANLFSGPMPEAEGDVPDPSVALINEIGLPPQAYVSGGSRSSYLTGGVQVRIRSGVEDYQGGQQLALAVQGALHLASVSPYTVVAVESSSLGYFGPDATGRHRWAFHVVAGYINRP